MTKILLVCANGMSTSMVAKKMQKSAESRNIEVEIKAVSDSELQQRVDEADLVLIAPQIQYMDKKIKDLAKSKGIIADLINPADFGMANGEKILDSALKLL